MIRSLVLTVVAALAVTTVGGCGGTDSVQSENTKPNPVIEQYDDLTFNGEISIRPVLLPDGTKMNCAISTSNGNLFADCDWNKNTTVRED